MWFALPQWLLALPLALLPLILHLWKSQPQTRVRWAAMGLLQRASHQELRRTRIQQWLLLAARTAILLIGILLLARPQWRSAARPAADEVVTILWDNTASMAIRSGGLSRADLIASHVLAEAKSSGARFRIVPMVDVARGAVLTDAADLQARLAELPPTSASAEMATVLSQFASRRTANAPGPLWIASDFQRRQFEPPAVRRQLGQLLREREVRYLSVPLTEVQNSGTVAEVEVDPFDGNQLRVFGSVGPESRQLQVRLAGHVAFTAEIPADTRGVLAEDITLPDVSRSDDDSAQRLEVRLLPADAVPTDDRFFRIRRKPAATRVVLLSDGKGEAASFVTAALQAANDGPAARFDISVRPIPPAGQPDDGLLLNWLEEADLVVWPQIAALPAELRDQLTTFVRRGGMLLAAVGPRTTPLVGTSANGPASALFPGPLIAERAPEEPVRLRPQLRPETGDATTAGGVTEFLMRPDVAEALSDVHVFRYLELQTSSDADVWLRYSDGRAALIAQEVGQGAVVLWTSSLDRRWTDLPIRRIFVPLILEVASSLRERQMGIAALTAAESQFVPLPASWSGTSGDVVVALGGHVYPAVRMVRDGSEGVMMPAWNAGFATLRSGANELPLAILPDRRERSVECLDPRTALSVDELHADGPPIAKPAGRSGNAVPPLSRGLLLVLVLMLLLEALIGGRLFFRGWRRAGRAGVLHRDRPIG